MECGGPVAAEGAAVGLDGARAGNAKRKITNSE
jgi:hypothetical protein